ncbi:MAG: sodium-dependent transporter [Halieaceae bacterium]|jgi:NSS family neurotransmitter:Na+ symporter|nr:sodium-dependent transporter [Halieaceae bacterium]
MAGGAHSHWTSPFAFLMASVGFAVGLGNIWRFPYVAGENGGSAFVLIYLVCAVVIGAPILMAEVMIGRRGDAAPPIAMARVAGESGRSRQWQWVGGMGLIAAYCIEIVYSVVVGWVLWYLFKAVTTGFAGVDAGVAEAQFTAVLGDNAGMLFWTVAGLAITGFIIYSGVKDGIERAVTIMMPLMFCLLLGLAVFNFFAGGFQEALRWMLTPDFSKVTFATVLAAVGQAFFSISVGMGGMMTYGSYLPREVSISRSVLVIVCADTAVALLAGFVVFPAVFNFNLDPAAGPGLIFQTLPVAFAQMPGGHIFAVLFFLMLAVAGITSMVGLVECVNAWIEEHFGLQRHVSALIVVGSIAVLSVLSILSYNVLDGLRLGSLNFNDFMDYFSNQILLPLSGLLIAIFAGWFMLDRFSRDEFTGLSEGGFRLWRQLIRFVVPPALLVIFIMGVSG